MRKDDNDWSITEEAENLNHSSWNREVSVNGTAYLVHENTACLAHCLLLLIDAINDKDFK